MRGRAPRGVTGELSPASVYVSLLPVVEACVVVAVPGRVGEVRVAADEPEAVDLDPGVLARRLDAPATVKAVLEQGGRVLLRSRAVRDPGPSGGRVRGVAKQRPSFLRNFAEGTEDDSRGCLQLVNSGFKRYPLNLASKVLREPPRVLGRPLQSLEDDMAGNTVICDAIH